MQLDNNQIKAAVEVCAKHILKGSKGETPEDKAAIALILNVLVNLNDIAYALVSINSTLANRR